MDFVTFLCSMWVHSVFSGDHVVLNHTLIQTAMVGVCIHSLELHKLIIFMQNSSFLNAHLI